MVEEEQEEHLDGKISQHILMPAYALRVCISKVGVAF
jgi:hypothetical protein